MRRTALAGLALLALASCGGGPAAPPDGPGGVGGDASGDAAAAADAAPACSAGAPAAPVTFSLAPLPLDGPEIANPFRGSYEWYGLEARPPGWPLLDGYARYSWIELEPERDAYDFARLDAELAAVEARGGKFGLRVKPACTGCGEYADSMPAYMHDLMPDGWWFSLNGSDNYAPDWNDPDYLERLEALLRALAARYGDDPRLGWIDISAYGDWGEWHVWQWPYPAPTGATDITDDNARAIVELNHAVFPTKRLVMPHDHDAALAHAMSLSPRTGVRNDCLGEAWFTDANTAARPVIGERWKTAPFVTEYCYQAPGSGGFARSVGQVAEFHVAMIGNGNMAAWNDFSADEQDALRAAYRSAGYRFELRAATLPGELDPGCPFTVATTWANVGVTPAYSPWDVVLELRDGAGARAWRGVSSLDLEALLPADAPVEIEDAFTLGALAPGSYQLVVVVEDREAYYAPLALGVEGRAADGAYPLGTVTIR